MKEVKELFNRLKNQLSGEQLELLTRIMENYEIRSLLDEGNFIWILWHTDDLKDALKNAGYEPSNKNVHHLLKEARCARILKDTNISDGWQTLDIIIEDEADHLDKLVRVRFRDRLLTLKRIASMRRLKIRVCPVS